MASSPREPPPRAAPRLGEVVLKAPDQVHGDPFVLGGFLEEDHGGGGLPVHLLGLEDLQGRKMSIVGRRLDD